MYVLQDHRFVSGKILPSIEHCFNQFVCKTVAHAANHPSLYCQMKRQSPVYFGTSLIGKIKDIRLS